LRKIFGVSRLARIKKVDMKNELEIERYSSYFTKEKAVVAYFGHVIHMGIARYCSARTNIIEHTDKI